MDHRRSVAKRGETRLKRDKRQLLTPAEVQEVVAFLKVCIKDKILINKKEVKDLVRKTLLVRSSQQKNMKGKYRQPLTEAEKRVLRSPHLPSDEWIQNFFAKYSDEIKLMRPRYISTDRYKTYTPENIDLMFKGEDGLQDVLIRAGIMDCETLQFDPKRLLNMDECPEFIDNQEAKGGRENQVVSTPGVVPIATGHLVRESHSVNMVIGCDGSLYGPHYIFTASTLNSNHEVTDRLKELCMEESFTERFEETTKMSTHCVVSATANGVQTAESLSARLDVLVKELTERKITFPVVLMIDGHKSRIKDIAARWFSDNYKFIIPFMLLPKTSTWSQPLDQINRTYHEVSRSAKNEYKLFLAYQQGKEKKDIVLTQQVSSVSVLFFIWSSYIVIVDAGYTGYCSPILV
jgi:phage pi2 protein 07